MKILTLLEKQQKSRLDIDKYKHKSKVDTLIENMEIDAFFNSYFLPFCLRFDFPKESLTYEYPT